MLVLLGPLVSHTISTSEALVHTDALCCWGHLALTASTQKGFGVLRCLERSRLMLVLLGAPFSYTNDALVRADAWTSFGPCLVLLGAPSWYHRGVGAPRCLRQSRFMLVMMGALVLHTIGTSRALVRADA